MRVAFSMIISLLHEFRSQIRFMLFRPNHVLRPNHTENTDKMDVSALKTGQSHTKIQNTPPHSPGKIP